MQFVPPNLRAAEAAAISSPPVASGGRRRALTEIKSGSAAHREAIARPGVSR